MTTQAQPAGADLQVPTGLTLPEKVVEHVSVTSTALEKAAAFQEAHRQKAAQVDALIPRVLDVMIENERINPQQRDKLAAMLRDPAQVLELMVKVAGHRNADELAKLGSGVNPDAPGHVKTAADNSRGHYDPAQSLNDPNVGARTTRVKQSDANLFQGLGLSAPTEE